MLYKLTIKLLAIEKAPVNPNSLKVMH